MTAAPSKPEVVVRGGELHRTVGFWGLTFVSLGSIIGSGWLLGALNASEIAGPAAVLTWVLGAVILGSLALVYAELGGAYPVAGGTGRYAFYSHGPVAGFVSAWASWLQAVFIAPVEVLAALAYLNSVGWVGHHFDMLTNAGLLNLRGIIVAVLLMILFTIMNLGGAKFMSESNSIIVIWKTAVPILAVGVIASYSFHPHNFTSGGGFMPHGVHGVFAALTGGVVFAMQGFEQACQMAGEARNPKRDISRAVLFAMAIGATIYTALQVVFIAGVNPADVAKNWDHPLEKGDYGAYYTLALAIGATWLATILIIDAVVSPSGTGIVYVATTARLSYALGQEKELPKALASTNSKGVPVVSIIVTGVLGCLAFGPFKSWGELVDVVTGATAIMYCFGPVALATLHKHDLVKHDGYRAPIPKVLFPATFCFANLILYWGGFDVTWKLIVLLLIGLLIFGIGSSRTGGTPLIHIKSAIWIAPWLAGQLIIGELGQYGHGELRVIPNNWDILVMVIFSLAIYYLALYLSSNPEYIQEAIEADRRLEPFDDGLVTS